MDWKNQLTKTPYLVLFIVLISVGVGTASALITITLSGDVHVTGDTTLDGELTVGAGSTNNDDFIRFDGGNEFIQWDETVNRFTFSESLNIDDGGSAQDSLYFDNAGQITYHRLNELFAISHPVSIQGPVHTGVGSLVAPYNSMGFGLSNFGLNSATDLLVVDDLEVGGTIISTDTLKVVAPGTLAIFDRTGGDGPLVIFDKSGVGKGSISISGETVSYNAFTGSHYAWTTQELERGLLVSMNGDNKYLNDNPNNEILYGVKISQTKNDPAILGTYLSILDTSLVSSLDNPALITSEGNGEVWVANTGTDIKPGDYMISSIVPGHAMKDDHSEKVSHIIGRAAEPIVWNEVSETVDGIKHKKISILFNFVPLNNNIVD